VAPPKAPVLVVEDDEDTRDVLEQILAVRGYAAKSFASGREALDYLRGGGRACVIILDLHLPDVGGVEICDELKADARFSDVPVVIYSATDKRNRPEGAVAFVGKTSDPDVLLAAVEKHCRKD
jgi:CheY-like chemotaxis protein